MAVMVWTFERDQRGDERNVSESLKNVVRESMAVVFLLSPYTIESGAAQWMELAYADAFGIPTFVLLHHLTYEELVRIERGVPPLVRQSQCTPAIEFRKMEADLRNILTVTPKGSP